jgi:hypothetical protein
MGTTDEVLPIGRVENLRVEDNRLIGTPIFDAKDEFALKLENKWLGGYLKMVSPNFEVIETSSAPELLKPGQTRETVTRCKLIEVSLVDIGSNDDALMLSADGKETTIKELNSLTLYSMEKIALKLGLDSKSDQEAILSAIGALQLKAQEHDGLKKEVETMKLAAITQAVDAAVAEKRITADRKEHFLTLGKQTGLDSLKLTLESIPVAQKPMDFIKPGASRVSSDDRFNKSWDELDKAGLLLALRKENENLYKEKYYDKFGV